MRGSVRLAVVLVVVLEVVVFVGVVFEVVEDVFVTEIDPSTLPFAVELLLTCVISGSPNRFK